MPNTIPPDGKSSTIREDSQAPMLSLADFPVVVVWQIEYADGVHSHGVNLVHSQSALNSLHRLLRQEHLAFKAATSLKLMRSDDLSVEPRAVRMCGNPGHNGRGIPHDHFCYECGKPTHVVMIVEGE